MIGKWRFIVDLVICREIIDKSWRIRSIKILGKKKWGRASHESREKAQLQPMQSASPFLTLAYPYVKIVYRPHPYSLSPKWKKKWNPKRKNYNPLTQPNSPNPNLLPISSLSRSLRLSRSLHTLLDFNRSIVCKISSVVCNIRSISKNLLACKLYLLSLLDFFIICFFRVNVGFWNF